MTIIKNHPFPKANIKTYPELGLLEVGDATAFPKADYHNLNGAMSYLTLKTGKKFTRRTIGEEIVVWRLV